MQDFVDPTASIVVLATTLASLIALFYLFQKHIAGERLLPYEPRPPVPWGGGLVLVAMLFPLSTVAHTLLFSAEVEQVAFENEEETEQADVSEEELDPTDFIINGLANVVVMLGFVALVAGMLLASDAADARDLGLPADRHQAAEDAAIGIVACVAALMPIYIVQVVLYVMFQPTVQHPLIEQLMQHRSPAMMLIGFLTAVIAAPIYEEFAFRVLLQGWLEKVEDSRLGIITRVPRNMEEPIDEDFPVSDPLGPLPGNPFNIPVAAPKFPADRHGPNPFLPHSETGRPAGAIAGLPHGWAPILISGTLFGLAHLGHGVAPVPLVLFGIVLGYLYQRTHRIMPSIAAHALFNTYSLVLLWLQIE